MRLSLRTVTGFLLLSALLWLPGTVVLHAQTDSPASTTAASGPAKSSASDDENTDQFRHTPTVEAMARSFHVSTETAAEILGGRTATIQKQLVEARSATEVANERLAAVEAKLAKLGGEIEAIRQQTDRDMIGDEQRIKQSLEDERVRIVKAAEQEIESAGAAAQRDLKRFAAELAIDKAISRIQLTAEADKAIVQNFGQNLVNQFSKGAQN